MELAFFFLKGLIKCYSFITVEVFPVVVVVSMTEHWPKDQEAETENAGGGDEFHGVVYNVLII